MLHNSSLHLSIDPVIAKSLSLSPLDRSELEMGSFGMMLSRRTLGTDVPVMTQVNLVTFQFDSSHFF